MSMRQAAIGSDLDAEVDGGSLAAEDAVRVRTFRLVLRAARELQYRMDRLLERDGLTTQQAAVLTVVRAADGPPSLSELAAALRTSHQNVRQIADALARKGFLRVVGDRSDGRVRRLHATAACERYWRARNPDDYRAVSAWFAALSTTEIGTLHDLLLRLSDDLRGRP